jgi:V-type H+-transporting ATPase subunit F
LEEAVRGFLNNDEISILLLVQHIADQVRHITEAWTKITPAILEIPSKEHAYDPAKDWILKRAKSMFSAEDMR